MVSQNGHEKSIFEQGMIWSKVPPEIRSSPVLLKWYGNGLKAIARFCADRLGKPELMEQVKAFAKGGSARIQR